jgi:hypothetical protein
MNPDDTTVGTIVLNNGTLGMVSGNSGGITTIANTITVSVDSAEEIMERWIFNRVTVDHKVQEQELMKLKEVAPDYANEIKEA